MAQHFDVVIALQQQSMQPQKGSNEVAAHLHLTAAEELRPEALAGSKAKGDAKEFI